MTREKILDTFSVFLRSLSFQGVQTVAENLMSDVLFELKRRFSDDPLEVLFIAMDNIRPLIFLKSVKKGGSIQKVPSFLPFSKQRHLGIRWLILGARTRSARNLLFGLVEEVSDAYSNRNCFSQRKRQELHKLALINRSFLRSFSK
jgi:small subunit ribosomal protein S7